MKKKQIWMTAIFMVLLILCAMLVFSRAGEASEESAGSGHADVDLILPPQASDVVQTPAYENLPDIDITSWEYLFVNQSHSIGQYAPEVTAVGEGNTYFDTRAVEAFRALLQGARDAGFAPHIYCAYRPYATQESQFSNEVAKYVRQGYSESDAKKAAALVVAEPGTSEHQTGLSADVVDQYYESLSVDRVDASFMQWLREHCAEYGFILRYPEEKADVTGRNEPWHVRYVGPEAAQFMMENGLCMGNSWHCTASRHGRNNFRAAR